MQSFFCFSFSSSHLNTCKHRLIQLLLNLTLTFPGDFPQRYECVCISLVLGCLCATGMCCLMTTTRELGYLFVGTIGIIRCSSK